LLFLREPQRKLSPIEYELLSGVRFDYKWAEVEKEEGVYDFSEFDKVLDHGLLWTKMHHWYSSWLS
jgi:hypothetical protein